MGSLCPHSKSQPSLSPLLSLPPPPPSFFLSHELLLTESDLPKLVLAYRTKQLICIDFFPRRMKPLARYPLPCSLKAVYIFVYLCFREGGRGQILMMSFFIIFHSYPSFLDTNVRFNFASGVLSGEDVHDSRGILRVVRAGAVAVVVLETFHDGETSGWT